MKRTEPDGESRRADKSDVSGSQRWPDVSRSQWPGVVVMRSYETVGTL
jgi:hypothetical protein